MREIKTRDKNLIEFYLNTKNDIKEKMDKLGIRIEDIELIISGKEGYLLVSEDLTKKFIEDYQSRFPIELRDRLLNTVQLDLVQYMNFKLKFDYIKTEQTELDEQSNIEHTEKFIDISDAKDVLKEKINSYFKLKYPATNNYDYTILNDLIKSVDSNLLDDNEFIMEIGEYLSKENPNFTWNALEYNEQDDNNLDVNENVNIIPPIIKKERKHGKKYGIRKRYQPTTQYKKSQRLFSVIGGVGIMSFLFMTIGKLTSPSEAKEECISTFENMLSKDMLETIFGDIRTYFESISSKLSSTIGYIIFDDKYNEELVVSKTR